MRILHTSDWHLGATCAATSRAPDHELFLGWLESKLTEHHVDVLVVAGDIFDTMQPSAEAQTRYYRFLGKVALGGLRQVVIVGGNHDGASRLDAPSELLSSLKVHVVGGIGSTNASQERCLLALRDHAGQVAAVALAVPYVHEFRLGVRTTDLDHQAVRAAFTERFTALYASLVDQACARWPGVPIVATGHITLGSARREDYPNEIHQIGQIESLPTSVLDPRIQYTALGHIHRPCAVLDSRAWYCGTPVALTLQEMKTPRRVLLVDLDPDPAGRAQVEHLMVPVFRALLEIQAPPQELLARVRDLEWDEPLPPLLHCRVVSDEHVTSFTGQLHQALESFPEARRPALAELKEVRASDRSQGDAEEPASLRELGPMEVFATLCEARGVRDLEDLRGAFAQVASISPGDLEEMLKDIEEGRA